MTGGLQFIQAYVGRNEDGKDGFFPPPNSICGGICVIYRVYIPISNLFWILSILMHGFIHFYSQLPEVK